MNPEEKRNIILVLVTFNPDMDLLERGLNSIAEQVTHCYIIDNGNTKINFQNIDNLDIINLGKNYGIAYAQNIGIEHAQKDSADFILLSDQDTIFPENYISRMLDVYDLYCQCESIGAIVPACKDEFAISLFKTIKAEKGKIYHVSHGISSGTIIPMKSLEIIGKMREELFIDYVDLEWCCRATKCGYNIICIPDIIIKHQLGDSIKTIGNRKIIIRTKTRYYYTIRNGIYIIAYTNVLSLQDKLLFINHLFVKCIRVFVLDRVSLKLIFKAIHDGLNCKMFEIKE